MTPTLAVSRSHGAARAQSRKRQLHANDNRSKRDNTSKQQYAKSRDVVVDAEMHAIKQQFREWLPARRLDIDAGSDLAKAQCAG